MKINKIKKKNVKERKKNDPLHNNREGATENNKESITEFLNQSTSLQEIKRKIPDILEYFLKYGESNTLINIWAPLQEHAKQLLIKSLYNFLLTAKSADRFVSLELLEVLYNATRIPKPDEKESIKESNLSFQLRSIFYAGLFEKEDYRIPLAVLKFFKKIWKKLDCGSNLRNEILNSLLDALESKESIVVEELIFEIIKMMDDAVADQQQRVFKKFVYLGSRVKDSFVQYAFFEGIKELIRFDLSSIIELGRNFLIESIHSLINNKHLNDPKPILSIISLINENRIPLNEEDEKKVIKLFKIAYKKISFEYLSTFWDQIRLFCTLVSFNTPNDVLRPYIKKIQELFKERAEIPPDVAVLIEKLVEEGWDNNWFLPKEKDGFYN